MTSEMESQFAALKEALMPPIGAQGTAAEHLAPSYGPVAFEPGDATSYAMHLTRIDDARVLGYSRGCWVLTVLNMPGHVWTFGEWIGPYDLEAARGVTVNPWTIRACLLWLESLKIDGLTVDISEELRRGR